MTAATLVLEPIFEADLAPRTEIFRFNQLAQMRFKPFVRRRLPSGAKAGYVGGEDRDETAGSRHSSGIPALRRPAK
jgi:hypothetical protein